MVRVQARRKWMGVAGGCAAVLALAWYAWPGSASVSSTGSLHDGAASWFSRANGAESDQTVSTTVFRTGVERLPASLQGTDVDGELMADANGHLLVRRGVRNCFDYFLSLVGEAPMPEIRARIEAYIQSHLASSAREEAMALLGRYLAYRDAAQSLGNTSGSMDASLDALQARMDTLAGLRQQHFSAPERAAFFGDEEALAKVSLASLRVTRDTTLSAMEKAARLHLLTASLPAELRDAVSAQERYAQLTAVTQQLHDEGGDARALREARVQIVGEEAAGRLEALDAQRVQWQSRLSSFQSRRAGIMADASLSEVQRQAAVSQLATQSFSPTEWTRAQALLNESSVATR